MPWWVFAQIRVTLVVAEGVVQIVGSNATREHVVGMARANRVPGHRSICKRSMP